MLSNALVKKVNAITVAMAFVGLIVLIFVSGITVIDALLRRFLGTTINGLSDWLYVSTTLAVSSCFPACVWGRHAVAVRLLGKVLPGWKAGKILDLFGLLMMTGFWLIVIWQVGAYTWELFDYGEVTDLLLLPKWPVWAGAWVMLLATGVVDLFLLYDQACSSFARRNPVGQDEPALKGF